MDTLDKFFYSVLFGVADLLLIIIGILIIKKWVRCKTEVRAVFVKNMIFRYKETSRFSPVFKYNFESSEIQKETFQRFDKNEVSEFVSGQTYTIFIDKKNPENFVIERKIPFCDVMLALILILIGFISFVVLLFFDISVLL